LAGTPKQVDSIDADGVEWKVDGETLNIRLNRIGHHAVLRIS
jgi:hypothetical protein